MGLNVVKEEGLEEVASVNTHRDLFEELGNCQILSSDPVLDNF